MNRSRSPETRAKIRAALKGRTVGPETRAKISAAKKGRKLGPRTEQHLANLIAAVNCPIRKAARLGIGVEQLADYRAYRRKKFSKREALSMLGVPFQ